MSGPFRSSSISTRYWAQRARKDAIHLRTLLVSAFISKPFYLVELAMWGIAVMSSKQARRNAREQANGLPRDTLRTLSDTGENVLDFKHSNFHRSIPTYTCVCAH